MTISPSIVGHDQVLRRLHQAVANNALHHAYLFEGPKGLGKATVAEHLAMLLNCTSDDRPCGACEACHHISQQTHPDIIHVHPDEERASRTISVATIREVIRQTGYHHYSARHRVVIIDPAEAMVPAAANALLKPSKSLQTGPILC